MFDTWYQIYVKAPHADANTPSAMKRVDDTLTARFPACFVAPAPDGLPIINSLGEYEVRCFQEAALLMVKRALTEHHGLEITSVVKNE